MSAAWLIMIYVTGLLGALMMALDFFPDLERGQIEERERDVEAHRPILDVGAEAAGGGDRT